MSQFKKYFEQIAHKRAELAGQFPEGCCFVVSNGSVCEVSLDIAARLLTEGTHQIATEAEAAKFRAAQAQGRAKDPLVETLAEARARFAALSAAGKDKAQ